MVLPKQEVYEYFFLIVERVQVVLECFWILIKEWFFVCFRMNAKRNGKSKGILKRNLTLAWNSGPKVRIKGKHLTRLSCKDWPRVRDQGNYLMLSCLVNKPKVYFSSILTNNEPKESYGEHVIHTRKRDKRKIVHIRSWNNKHHHIISSHDRKKKFCSNPYHVIGEQIECKQLQPISSQEEINEAIKIHIKSWKGYANNSNPYQVMGQEDRNQTIHIKSWKR